MNTLFILKSELYKISPKKYSKWDILYLTYKKNDVYSLLIGSLAQLVEQLAFNQFVTGSSPVRPTSYY